MPVDISGASPVGIPGVWQKSGVKLSPQAQGFLVRLAATGVGPVVVTSGTRTAEEQAAEMRRDADLYGVGHWDGLYRAKGLVAEIQAGPTTTAGIAATIRAQESRGDYISNHQGGRAVDLRTRGLTPDERAALIAAVASLGVSYLDEGDHVHVGGIGAAFLPFSPLALGAGAAVLGAGLYLWQRG